MPNRTPKQQPAPHAAKDAKDVERMRLEHDLITDSGIVPATKGRHAIYCLTVIGTIEGHSLAPDNQKSTKYEHVIPQLVDIEEDPAIEGLLVSQSSTLMPLHYQHDFRPYLAYLRTPPLPFRRRPPQSNCLPYTVPSPDHGPRLEPQTNQGGISRMAPLKLASEFHCLPPILHKSVHSPM